MKFYPDKFRDIRLKKSIKLNDIAKKTGINRITLWTWEKGKVIPAEKKIRLLSSALNVTSDQISDLPPETPSADEKQITKEFASFLYSFSSSDMEERMKLQDNLLQSLKAQYSELNRIAVITKTFMDTVPTLFYSKSVNGDYLTANKSFLMHLGLDDNYKVFGKRDRDLLSEKEAILNDSEDSKLLINGKALNYEGTIPGTRGKKWGLISKIPVFDSKGKISGLIACINDITERKKAESRSNELIGALGKMDEVIWMCCDAKERPGGGIIFNDFLYILEGSITRSLFPASANLSFNEVFNTLINSIVQEETTKRHSFKELMQTGVSEGRFRIKLSEQSAYLPIRSRVYLISDNLYAGIIMKDESYEILEGIRQKMEELKMPPELINEILKAT